MTTRARTLSCGSYVAGVLGLAIAACGPAPEARVPQVLGVDDTSLVLGQTLNFVGRNFATAQIDPITGEGTGRTRIQFEGVFEMEGGRRRYVDLTIAPDYDGTLTRDGAAMVARAAATEEVEPGDDVLRWNRFGPFENPFSDEQQPGTFNGVIRAITTFPDGSSLADPNPPEITLHVEPSILIEMLEPVVGFDDAGNIITPECGHPALRAIEGLPYVLQVRAMGFTPLRFTYEFSGINGGQVHTFEHDVSFPVDRVGDPAWHPDELVVFDRLPDDAEFGVSNIIVRAEDASGNTYYNALPISVVRPLQYKTDAKRTLGQYYEPEVVWGPIVGSIGTSISYSESFSEQRQRGVAIKVSKDFTSKQGMTNTQTFSEGIEVSNTISEEKSEGTAESITESNSETYGTTQSHTEGTEIGYSTTDGTNWSYNVSDSTNNYEEEVTSHYNSSDHAVKAGGGIEIPILSWFTGKIGYDYTNGSGTRTTTNSGTRTEQTITETNGQSRSETNTFGTTVNDTTSETFSGTYGVSSQSTINRTTSRTEANSESVTYKMGNEASLEESYTIGESEAYNQSWVDTESYSVGRGMSTKVPRGRCAVVYRQTIRWVRKATIYAHNLCGIREPIANMTFNEWDWGAGFGIADECSTQPPPPMDLPPAKCFAGCTGN